MKLLFSLPFIMLFLIGCSAPKKVTQSHDLDPVVKRITITSSPWELTIMNGRVIHSQMDRNPYIKLNENTISGNGGCNTFQGNYTTLNEGSLYFEKLISTKMACPDLVIENAFIKTLQETTGYQINGDTLILLNAEKYSLAKFIASTDLKE